MGRFLLFVFYLFVLSVLPAAAHEAEYTITEAELLRLEKILGNWEKNKRNQQSQVQSLKQRLTEALSKSESLSKQLQTERETLTSLRQFYNKYEEEARNDLQKKQNMIDNLKTRGYKLKLALVILSCILGFLILGNVVFFILKMKLKFL